MNTANDLKQELPLLLICLLNYSDYHQFISLTILSSNKDIEDIKQLKTLELSGTTFKNTYSGGNIHSVIILLISSFQFNYFAPVGCWPNFWPQQFSISGFWQPSLIVISLLVIFYSITKGFIYFKIDKLEWCWSKEHTYSH